MSDAIGTTIGLMPATGQKPDEQRLFDKIDSNPVTKGLVQAYLTKQGIPAKDAKSASARSLALAYVNLPYLKGWRKRVNPTWDMLSEADEDEGLGQEKAETAAVVIDEKQIAALVKTLVDQQIAGTKLSLDDNAKEQIRAIARIAAQATATELAKPRIIEIHHNGEEFAKGKILSLGLQHERFPTLLRAVQARDHRGHKLNIWLTGPTGSGKTSVAEAIAKALDLPFGADSSLDADYKVLGFRDANGNIVSTEFIRIYQNGGIYIADEVDNWQPSALLSLNAALANGWMTTPGGMIQRHKDCCIIACANTWGLGATGDYVGRTRLDAASLDRFQPKIDWPYDEKLERAIAISTDSNIGPDWCLKVQAARHRAREQGLKVIISPRATFAGIALIQAGFETAEVIGMTIAAGLSEEQKKAIGLTMDTGLRLQPPTMSVRDLLNAGKRIEAIKLHREEHDCSLLEAKEAIEAIEREGDGFARVNTMQAGHRESAA